MKFKVCRTSDCLCDKGKPCEEAKYEKVECRSLYNGDKRLIDYYVVEINSLEELIDFVKKYGCIILDESNDPKYFEDFSKPIPLYEIEIYDDYRE